jgi:hypothetical protein
LLNLVETTTIQSEKISSQSVEMTSMISPPIGCTEAQIVDEKVSEMITVSQNDLPNEQKMNFAVTSFSGVSFPANNIQQFQVIFYSND